VDSSAAKSAEKFPILGDIPILGKLFRSDGFRGNRTELVMFVTPRVISPESQENIDALERGNSIQERGKEAMSRRNKEFVQ
jgi:pilus assembly protein CpaC